MIINGVRQLVTIQKIDKIAKHPNADRLSIATIGLWEMITAAPLNVGDEVLFFEIDSMIPLTDSRFEFLKGRNEKTLNGVAYSRLRTMRLRGELSQGLIIPIKEFEREVEQFLNTENDLDLQEILGVKKYEAPAWIARGKGSNPEIGNSFPDCVPKTDQERCLEYNTLITTNKGLIKIGEIVDANMNVDVLTFNHTTNNTEFKPIIAHSKTDDNKEWLKIKLKSGKEIICTTDHKIFNNGAYMDASEIKVGDKLITHG